MEKRKLREIEHSKKLREIFQGFERISDTHTNEQEKNLEDLIIDKELFNEYFSNMKYYAITKSSEDYKFAWLKDRCGEGKKIIDFACGNGENGIFAAQYGTECIGIDIDPTTTENANANAISNFLVFVYFYNFHIVRRNFFHIMLFLGAVLNASL